MRPRLAALFVAALLGTLVVVGLALAPLGRLAITAYLLLLALGLVGLVRRARAQRAPEGRTCTCCTSTVYDPVEVH